VFLNGLNVNLVDIGLQPWHLGLERTQHEVGDRIPKGEE
jgi:hypothetical protein